MGWQPSRTSQNMDLDSSVAMITEEGGLDFLVYYGRLHDKARSVEHHGDHLYGTESAEDDETISIDLSKVPARVKCLAFIVNIYKSGQARADALRCARHSYPADGDQLAAGARAV